MIRYQILIEYEGTNFRGWQVQKKGKTIQGHIQKKISKLLKEKIVLFGSGRTDTGVHAIEQSAHFDCKKKIIDKEKFLKSINYFLNKEKVAILKIRKRNSKFHARFSAKKRWYEYKIINRRPPLTIDLNRAWCVYKNLDVEKMKIESTAFLGKHDLNAFRSAHCQSKNSVKTIDNLIIKKENDQILIEIAAKSFLHSQVRIIVGTLVDIAKGNIGNSIKEIIRNKKREGAGQTAPSSGLYLSKIEY